MFLNTRKTRAEVDGSGRHEKQCVWEVGKRWKRYVRNKEGAFEIASLPTGPGWPRERWCHEQGKRERGSCCHTCFEISWKCLKPFSKNRGHGCPPWKGCGSRNISSVTSKPVRAQKLWHRDVALLWRGGSADIIQNNFSYFRELLHNGHLGFAG